MHISQLIWIVVEDATHISLPVKQLLDRSGLEYYYLAVKRRPRIPARGWTGRDAGLNFVRKRFASLGNNAVVYFADDDNTYDIRLFNRYIRNVEKVGVWAVGLVAHNAVEAPKVLNAKVVGWQTIYAPKRRWGFDMAGFAIKNILLTRRGDFLLTNSQDRIIRTYKLDVLLKKHRGTIVEPLQKLLDIINKVCFCFDVALEVF
ncbi:glycosyltransferase [Wuchereria bancrofti]|uniref:Galactosylgalactosylxylosylprotein 3-beta-glucuronosyltransferase n=1 Tax=Wuchereria bancrofti TaxID=6293 RepID=J9F2D1_WUCBA|nr:glycosyltransferase [Wuchereria bancrofti]